MCIQCRRVEEYRVHSSKKGGVPNCSFFEVSVDALVFGEASPPVLDSDYLKYTILTVASSE